MEYKMLMTVGVLMLVQKMVHCGECNDHGCLTNLYNSQVVQADHVTRPMASTEKKNVLFVDHHGVRVTLESGDQYLIHKGPSYGAREGNLGPDTVIRGAEFMSDKWTTKSTASISGHTVNDFMKAGHITSDYNLVNNNCIQASKDMMRLGDKKN